MKSRCAIASGVSPCRHPVYRRTFIHHSACSKTSDYARKAPPMIDDVSSLTKLRTSLPRAAAKATEIVMDNPGSCLILAAGVITAAAAARNLVKPRTAIEAIALAIALNAVCTYGASYVITSGLLPFRLRDAEGRLHEITGDAGSPASAA